MLTRALLAAAALLGLGAQPTSAGAVLDGVKSRQVVRCGVGGQLQGFSTVDSQGRWNGLDVDYCRAVAAAVLGDPNKVTFVPLSLQQRFTALQAGEVDVLARDSVMNLTRDVSLGITFIGVNFYTGTGVAVPRSAGIKSLDEMDGASICSAQGGSNMSEVVDYMRTRGKTVQALIFQDVRETNEAFFAHRCDGMTAGAADLAATIASAAPKPADYLVLPNLISRDPYAPAVRRGDPEWFSIARWTLYALIEAEEQGVTRANAEELARTSTNVAVRRLLGAEDNLGGLLGVSRDWAIRAIQAVGNYGEVYDRHFGPDTPSSLPRGPNNVFSKGGLHYSPPFR